MDHDADADPEADPDADADADTRLYCYCQKQSYGEMIGCDDDGCQFEWVSPLVFGRMLRFFLEKESDRELIVMHHLHLVVLASIVPPILSLTGPTP